jgi:hypothetical protein
VVISGHERDQVVGVLVTQLEAVASPDLLHERHDATADDAIDHLVRGDLATQ